MFDSLSDQQLVSKALAGNKDAFSALIKRHQSWLYRFIRRYVWNSEDAFDVLQEALAAAWISLYRYDADQPFNVWLRSIGLHKCRDRARKNMVLRTFFSLDQEHELISIDHIEDPSFTPENEIEFKQAADAFYKAIANLPTKLKEPLILTALEGLSQKETAELLSISVKAVETRVYRAKQKLALALDESLLEILR